MNDPQLIDAIRKAVMALNQLATVLGTGGDVEHKPDARPAPKVEELTPDERAEARRVWKELRKAERRKKK